MSNEYNVTKCEFYIKDTQGCFLAGCVPKGYKTITNFKCRYNSNCYYKQLHSQEKTFTVEEIKKLQTETLIRLNPDDARKAQWLFSVFNNLLAKFEKAVE